MASGVLQGESLGQRQLLQTRKTPYYLPETIDRLKIERYPLQIKLLQVLSFVRLRHDHIDNRLHCTEPVLLELEDFDARVCDEFVTDLAKVAIIQAAVADVQLSDLGVVLQATQNVIEGLRVEES